MKAMIFAAGRGERMRPLTDTTPKPLLELAGKPLIVQNIERCKAAGIEDIVINVSYHADKIKAALGDGSKFGVRIQYSHEDPVLETAGGVIKALPLLGDKPFLGLAADVWADLNLQSLIAQAEHVDYAHLVLVDNPEFHPDGDFALMDGVVKPSGKPRYTYSSIGIYHPKMFADLPEQRLGLGELLHQHLSHGKITGEHYQGKWFNLGTPEQLETAERLLKGEK